jgi:type IX secretion system PorP/SprF family membrane protein
MKYILLFIAFFGLAIGLQAQVDPLYAQYINNPLVINPAYTGINNNFNASLSYRKQWAGFDGSPSTANFSAHSSFLHNKMGMGVILIQDKVGANKNTEVNLTYAYKIMMTECALSFGLQGGFINFRSNDAALNPYDATDPTFASNQNFTKASLGAGVILKGERFFLGLSVPRMIKESTANGNSETTIYRQHFYASAAYVFNLSQEIHFKPSVLFKVVEGAPLSTDVNTSFILKENYTAGIFTRNLNTYGLLLQAKFGKGYRFGYICEMPTNKSVGVRYTSHEITFGINLSLLRNHKMHATAF